jgi:hypothetical protein
MPRTRTSIYYTHKHVHTCTHTAAFTVTVRQLHHEKIHTCIINPSLARLLRASRHFGLRSSQCSPRQSLHCFELVTSTRSRQRRSRSCDVCACVCHCHSHTVTKINLVTCVSRLCARFGCATEWVRMRGCVDRVYGHGHVHGHGHGHGIHGHLLHGDLVRI